MTAPEKKPHPIAGRTTAYPLKTPPPALVHVGRLPGGEDVAQFELATPAEQLAAVSYLRYMKSRHTGSSIVSAQAIGLTVLTIGVTVVVAQANASNLWGSISGGLVVLFVLVGFYGSAVILQANNCDERRAWAETWLLAFDPLYDDKSAELVSGENPRRPQS